MAAKVALTGAGNIILFQLLTQVSGEIKGNVEEFLIAKDRSIAGRDTSAVALDVKQLIANIDKICCD